MRLVTRTETLGPGEFARWIERARAGEQLYVVPEPDLSVTDDPFQQKINRLRCCLNLFSPRECAETCGLRLSVE